MSLIEGVGDEVTIFFGVLLLVILVVSAWLSTHVADRPFVSVVILDRNLFQRLMRRLREQNFQVINISLSQLLNRARGTNEREPPPADESPQNSEEAASDPAASETSTSTGETENADTESVHESHPQTQQPEEGDVIEQQTASDQTATPSGVESENYQWVEESILADRETASVSQPNINVPPSEPELRRRRVEFFEKHKENDNSSSSFSLDQREHFATAEEISCRSSESIPTPSEAENSNTNTNSQESSASQESSQSAANTGSLPSSQSVPDLEILEGFIRVKVKYLNDQQRWVHARPEDTVGHFKREHFASELAEDKVVRIIFNGRELREDTSTLTSYRLVDSSVVHCLLTENRNTNETNAPNAQNNEFDLGSLMFPLFGLILVLVWYCRVTYRIYFNAISTFALLGITFLFMIAFFASWRMHRVQEYEN